MPITVLYFARLREALGVEREEVDLPAEVADVGSVRRHLAHRGGEWAQLTGARVRAAVNQALATDASPVRSGDEVAFFPPVTGG